MAIILNFQNLLLWNIWLICQIIFLIIIACWALILRNYKRMVCDLRFKNRVRIPYLFVRYSKRAKENLNLTQRALMWPLPTNTLAYKQGYCNHNLTWSLTSDQCIFLLRICVVGSNNGIWIIMCDTVLLAWIGHYHLGVCGWETAHIPCICIYRVCSIVDVSIVCCLLWDILHPLLLIFVCLFVCCFASCALDRMQIENCGIFSNVSSTWISALISVAGLGSYVQHGMDNTYATDEYTLWETICPSLFSCMYKCNLDR